MLPGKEAEFKAEVTKAVAQTKKEVGAKDYNFTYVGNKCMVRELYQDVEAVLVHMPAIDPIMGKMATQVGKLEAFIVTAVPS